MFDLIKKLFQKKEEPVVEQVKTENVEPENDWKYENIYKEQIDELYKEAIKNPEKYELVYDQRYGSELCAIGDHEAKIAYWFKR